MGFDTEHASGDIKSPLMMSDEAVMEMTLPSEEGSSDEDQGAESSSAEAIEDTSETSSQRDSEDDTTTGEEDGEDESEASSEGGEEEGDGLTDPSGTASPGGDPGLEGGERSPDEETSDSAGDEEGGDSDSAELDYKSEYEKLLSTFRANGKDMKIDSVDDARKLMSMGANYNKKMAALKPNLTLMKMLQNNDLLDESKLSYLIDLDKKDPAAIAKLVQDSKYDPLESEQNESAADSYQPNTYTVGGNEVELDTVLLEIKDTSGFNATMDIVGTKWDEDSKRAIYADPSIVRVMNEHVESGVYDKVNAVVEKQRMLGQLDGLSDIEAYQRVGYQMREQGAFNQAQPAKAKPLAKPLSKAKVPNPKIKDKKRAASATRSSTGSKKASFDPLKMSDEEFMAQMDSRLR